MHCAYVPAVLLVGSPCRLAAVVNIFSLRVCVTFSPHSSAEGLRVLPWFCCRNHPCLCVCSCSCGRVCLGTAPGRGSLRRSRTGRDVYPRGGPAGLRCSGSPWWGNDCSCRLSFCWIHLEFTCEVQHVKIATSFCHRAPDRRGTPHPRGCSASRFISPDVGGAARTPSGQGSARGVSSRPCPLLRISLLQVSPGLRWILKNGITVCLSFFFPSLPEDRFIDF